MVNKTAVELPQLLERLKIQLLISTIFLPGLNIYMNSSFAPFGPRVRNSLMTIWSEVSAGVDGISVMAEVISVLVADGVGEALGVLLGVDVFVCVTTAAQGFNVEINDLKLDGECFVKSARLSLLS